MSKRMPLSMIVAIAAVTVAAPVQAQARSTASSATLDAAVAARPENSRAVVTAALSSPNAIAMAGRMGMSPAALEARVAALSDASAQQLADRIVAGGANLVISTTAIIIVLLILILLTR